MARKKRSPRKKHSGKTSRKIERAASPQSAEMKHLIDARFELLDTIKEMVTDEVDKQIKSITDGKKESSY